MPGEKTFGEFLKEIRIRYGYKTQKQLADISGISQTTLSRIEAGTQRPQPETLRVLAEYLRPYTYGELMEQAGYFHGMTSDDKGFIKDLFNESEELHYMIIDIIDRLSKHDRFDDRAIPYLELELRPLFESEGWNDIEFIPSQIKQLNRELDSNLEYKKNVYDALKRVMNLFLSESKRTKEERDIAADLERMINELESNEALAFHGEPMDEETKELMKISLENSLRLAKQMSKQKFNTNKNK